MAGRVSVLREGIGLLVKYLLLSHSTVGNHGFRQSAAGISEEYSMLFPELTLITACSLWFLCEIHALDDFHHGRCGTMTSGDSSNVEIPFDYYYYF